jgi:hypothetical protein
MRGSPLPAEVSALPQLRLRAGGDLLKPAAAAAVTPPPLVGWWGGAVVARYSVGTITM